MKIEQLHNFLSMISIYNGDLNKNTLLYNFIDEVLKNLINDNILTFKNKKPIQFFELGDLIFPYIQMGAISSLELFGLDELILFSFYYQNRNRYKRVLDIGANIGLHSIVLAKCGYLVDAYEPDPIHFEILSQNLLINSIKKSVNLHNSAISSIDGEMEFIRVLGNTTSSHLAGSKLDPYGKLEKIQVKVESISKILNNNKIDFIKIDAEGHEVTILESISKEFWNSLDAFVEIGSNENAEYIYKLFLNSDINIFSQKIGWKIVSNMLELPVNYKEGSIFISAKRIMPW